MYPPIQKHLFRNILHFIIIISLTAGLVLVGTPQTEAIAKYEPGKAVPIQSFSSETRATTNPQQGTSFIPPQNQDSDIIQTDFATLPQRSFSQTSFRGKEASPSLKQVKDFQEFQTAKPALTDLSMTGSVQSSPVGSFPPGVNPKSLPADKITIDITYDVVMGWVDPGQSVTVTAGTEGYGAAVADGIGFFWTSIWHNTEGHSIGIDCEIPLWISVDGATATNITPPCLDNGHILVSSDSIHGTIIGAGEGLTVTASLGSFAIYGGTPPSPGAPTGSDTTDSNGDFVISLAGVDLGAESLVAVDFDELGFNIRNYIIPQEVFMVHQMNSIAGYTAIGQTVNVIVYEGSSANERWSNSTTASWPHGYYLFENVPMEYGDLITVELVDGPTLSTTVTALGSFTVDATADTLHGNAPDGAPIRTLLWQWLGEESNYSEEHTTSGSSGFDISFTPDLKARDDVLVITTDTVGNQVQIQSGSPFLSALQDPLSDTDCVSGRVDAPYAPIIVSLDKGDGETYERITGWTSDAGNDFIVCFLVRDPNGNWGPINFDIGDIVTLSTGEGWSESVEVIDFDWSWNTATETISGQSMPAGDVEIILYQWIFDRYPLYGAATQQADVIGSDFTADFDHVDVRDGLAIDLSHYNTEGNGNTLYAWGQPALPFFELQLAQTAISGIVGTAFDPVTASLYADEFATEPLVTTSEDGDDDPYRFWLWNFGGHPFGPGMRVEISSASGWSAEMIVPYLSFSGDILTDKITGEGPQGLLFMEAYRDDESLGFFIPSGNSNPTLDTAFYGFNLRQGDTVALTYQAPDGNRARTEWRLGELFMVGHWFDYGARDWMWGEAQPGYSVTISINGGASIPTFFEDPNCPSCWGIHDPLDLNPGDTIAVTVSTGFSLTYSIPNPLTATADSETDIVSGQIGGRAEDWVNISTWWDGVEYQVTTSPDGSFILQSEPERPIEVPRGGEGNISFSESHSDVTVNFLQHFYTLDLVMEVNYGHDWVEGNYPSGYDVTLTVTENDGTTVKATTTITTCEVPWWGGRTGFSTNMDGVVWDPERPDIQAGDWVFGEVDMDGTIYSAEVQLGEITGEIDIESDSITGTIDADWLPQDVEVEVQCNPYGGAPPDTGGKSDSILPNGTDLYSCAWDPDTEWDIQPNHAIGVYYRDSGNHWIVNVFTAYTDELILQIHYDHNWINGSYEPGHEVFLQVADSGGLEKAHITLPTGYLPGWGSTSGFDTGMEGAEWIPSQPDIEPGDVIHGEVDDGSQFTADVEIGVLIANADPVFDNVTGTLDAEWLLPGPVQIGCYIWENNAPENKYDVVTPDGADIFECSWAGEWDLVPGSNLMVAYYEPDGHQIVGDFSPPAPHLRIEKWLEGGGSPGVGGNATFYMQYANHGSETAEDVVITDTMVGMTYLGDTSGITPSGGGSSVSWNLGDVGPGDWIHFFVFTQVTAPFGEPISNQAVITTSDPYDVGDEWEKVGYWGGNVAENDTYLNIGINPWTWNPAVGQTYVYAYNVCNNGSTGSSTVTLTVNLPTNTDFEIWWGREAGWEEISQSGHTLVVEHPSIPAWQCYEVYARVEVDPAAEPEDELFSSALIYANNDLSEDDNYAEVRHNIGWPWVDLGISANWHWGTLVPGGYYRYGIGFRNEGNMGISEPIEVTTTLPEGTSFADWDHWDWASIGQPTVVGNQITWLVDGLEAGYYGTIEVWVNIESNTLPGTILEHTVEIEIQPDETNLENNFSGFEETVYEHGPNLRIRKWGDWHGHGEGHNAWYQLQVENIGDQTIDDVVVTDHYPTEMELDGGINVGFWQWWEWEDFPAEDYFTITMERLEPGWNVGVNFNVVIPGDDPVPFGLVFTNTADVTLDPADANPDDNSAEYLLGSGPDMFVDKTLGEGEFLPGEEVSYLLTFGNKQPGHTWWWGMTGNAVLVDTLPVGMSFVSSYWHCYSDEYEWCEITPDIDGQELTWTLWQTSAGEWHEIRLTVLIDEGVEDGTELENNIEILSDQPTVDLDPFPDNNVSSYTGIVEVQTLYIYLPLIKK